VTVYESDLPGVCKKFAVELDDGRRLVVVIHNAGKRELFVREHPDADAETLFELSDRLARQVGTIMEGWTSSRSAPSASRPSSRTTPSSSW
jgi:TrkA domain protein